MDRKELYNAMSTETREVIESIWVRPLAKDFYDRIKQLDNEQKEIDVYSLTKEDRAALRRYLAALAWDAGLTHVCDFCGYCSGTNQDNPDSCNECYAPLYKDYEEMAWEVPAIKLFREVRWRKIKIED